MHNKLPEWLSYVPIGITSYLNFLKNNNKLIKQLFFISIQANAFIRNSYSVSYDKHSIPFNGTEHSLYTKIKEKLFPYLLHLLVYLYNYDYNNSNKSDNNNNHEKMYPAEEFY